MKKAILWATVILLAFAAYPVSAQEFIKRTPLNKSEGMIIRDYTGDKWLVYDLYGGGANDNLFILFTETGPSAQVLRLPNSVIRILDFEIYDDTVYFVGKDYTGAGIMGYFGLTSFPSTTVKMFSVPVMSSFDKLEVGLFNQELHVFMTGEEVLGGGHMVDARHLSGDYWEVCISLNIDLANQFDDVAVLNSGVVFSARKPSENQGFLFFFNAPSVGHSVFLPNTPYLDFGKIINGPTLLDASSADQFAWVHRTIYGYDAEGFGNWTVVLSYSSLGTAFVPTPPLFIDLSSRLWPGKAELLTENMGIFTTSNMPPPIAPPYLPFPSHLFQGEKLNSLDVVENNPYRFVVAGCDQVEHYLTIYRYERNIWPTQGCSIKESLDPDIPDKKILGDKQYINDYCIEIEAVAQECQTDEIPVIDECP